MSVTVNGTNGLTFADGSTQATGFVPGMRNRIINGDMRIDQRNAGASVTPTAGAYTLDRWNCELSQNSKFTVQQNAASVTPPVGYKNYLGVTSSSAYSSGSSDYFDINQRIEGLNCSDLAWGTANAKSVTLSFQVYSSLTGTFSGAIQNSGATRAYPFSYTVSSANTWTSISIVIPGDTSGTWLTTNGVGMQLCFDLGSGSTLRTTAGSWASGWYIGATGSVSVVGTNGATFYITGVQLESGTKATPFEYRHYGTELVLCQRYYEKSYDIATVPGTATTTGMSISRASAQAGGQFGNNLTFKVEKRSAPSVTTYNASTGASGTWVYGISGSNGTSTMSAVDIATSQCRLNSGTTVSAYQVVECAGHWIASAEL